VANYNDGPTLEAALTPFIEQTVPFDRILVVNDASTDNSLEILENLRTRAPQVEIINNARNLGVAAATNIGFAHATEDYVFPASANDTFSTKLVASAKQALEKMPDAGMIAGKLTRHYLQSGKKQTVGLPFPDDDISVCSPERYRNLAKVRPLTAFGGATIVHRKRALEMGGFRSEMKWSSDLFLFALLANRYGFAYVPGVFGTMSIRPRQYSTAIDDWSKQEPVIRSFFRILQQEYPKDYEDFRRTALLPSYNWQTLPLLLSEGTLRSYLTPKLLWRIALYKPLRTIARRLVPDRFFNSLRQLARV
jgi:glycosyltransferase involved in cell wall biosynthesis